MYNTCNSAWASVVLNLRSYVLTSVPLISADISTQNGNCLTGEGKGSAADLSKHFKVSVCLFIGEICVVRDHR